MNLFNAFNFIKNKLINKQIFFRTFLKFGLCGSLCEDQLPKSNSATGKEDAMSLSSLQRYQIFYMLTVSAVAITMALIYTRPVLLPLAFATFCYFASIPFMSLLERRLSTPRWLALAITTTMTSLISVIVVWQVSASFRGFLLEINSYHNSLINLVDMLNENLARIQITVDSTSIKKMVLSLPLKSYLTQFAGGAVGFIGNFFLVIVIYFFLMLGKREIATDGRSFMHEVEEKISGYIVNKLLLSMLTGVLVGAILLGFSVEMAVMFGVLAFVLNFIPTVGSLVATVLPVPIIVLQFGLGWKLIVSFALCSAVQLVIGNVVEPRIIGRDLDLHPVVMILSLIFWGLIWGLGGMFLAIPLTASLKILLSRIESTRDISEALAGRLRT